MAMSCTLVLLASVSKVSLTQHACTAYITYRLCPNQEQVRSHVSLLSPGSSKTTAIARVVPRHRLNPLQPNFNVVGSGLISAAFRKKTHPFRSVHVRRPISNIELGGDTGGSRILFIPDLMAVFFEEPGIY